MESHGIKWPVWEKASFLKPQIMIPWQYSNPLPLHPNHLPSRQEDADLDLSPGSQALPEMELTVSLRTSTGEERE